MQNQKKNEMNTFHDIFTDFDKDQKVAIITHVNPDPDAIGSAVGVQWLLKKKYHISADTFYAGEVDDSENKTMLNVLSLDLRKIEEYNDSKDDYAKVIVVDCTEQNIGTEANVDIIIDHHRTKPKKDKEEYDLVDIRAVGSCCTLIFDIIEQADIQLDRNSTDGDDVIATAMLLGVKTDTNDLLSDNTVDLDIHAYQYLAQAADATKVTAIKKYPFPKYLLEIEREAAKNEVYVGTAYVTFIGAISYVKRSALHKIADRMFRFEGITTAVVFGIVDNQIQVSVRSTDVSLDVDAFCKKILGKDNAGGKYGIGGGQVSLGFFSDYPAPAREAITEAAKLTMIDKISKHLTGEASDTAD
jgi:nanoRNase/pAp phosphatase (c-di-AMP/oligoRNAs hydrolase)